MGGALRVAFAGTPEFARVALARLVGAGFAVPLVLTQPDRPAGRGLQPQASPVKQWAQAQGLQLAQPHSLRLDGKWPEDAQAAREALHAARPDVMVVAAYGLILPPWVLELPRLGCLNIHASLLPRWRGAAPIQRAIEAGDRETGVTIMQMDAGLDTGDMLLVEKLPIHPDDTASSLHDRLAALGARLVVEALELAACGGLRATPQPTEDITYAPKIAKAEAILDWGRPAEVLERQVRAFNPTPGASTTLRGQVLKIWQARAVRSENKSNHHLNDMRPGTIGAIDSDGLVVRCGQGWLRLEQLQRAGGKRLAAEAFVRGAALRVGEVLGGDGAAAVAPTAAS